MNRSLRNLGWICGLLATGILPLSPAGANAPSNPYAELTRLETISEVMRHLYRWYLDHEDLTPLQESDTIRYYIVPLDLELDDGDNSLYADLVLPDLALRIRMKRTDYRIEELNTRVSSERFRIVNVEKLLEDMPLPPDAIDASFSRLFIMAYLFRTRFEVEVPSEDLSARLREAVRDLVLERIEDLPKPEAITVFLAPLSPVANEVWAYWQEANILVRWSSDIELTNPAVWEHESLAIRIINIEQQVVLSFSQVPGSNAYLTRDQIGRILYNCVVLGEKRIVQPVAPRAEQ